MHGGRLLRRGKPSLVLEIVIDHMVQEVKWVIHSKKIIHYTTFDPWHDNKHQIASISVYVSVCAREVLYKYVWMGQCDLYCKVL